MSKATAGFDRGADAFVHELRSIASLTGQAREAGEHRLDEQLSALVLSWDARSPAPLDAMIDELCSLALRPGSRDADLGRRLIFTSIAESLADSFEPDRSLLYERLFARVIDSCRRQRSGGALDRLLSRFRLGRTGDLLERKRRLERRGPLPHAEHHRVEHVLVPSRVTLGADVAVTSIVLQKVERLFPEAESVVFGPLAVGELLEGSARRVRFVDCSYSRRGSLVARLESWVHLATAVERDMLAHEPGSTLVLDPDSRLTQLGLLPLVPEDVPSFFFESRSYRRAGATSLGALTAHWLDDVLGPDEGDRLHPRVVPETSMLAAAAEVSRRARMAGNGDLTTMTFGVGGNARKRIPGRFELDLVRALLADGGVVVLDKGVDEEIGRAEAIVAAVDAEGTGVVELRDGPLRIPDGLAGRLLVHHGGLRSLLALIAVSDLYVGYDSAFQHVAAALSVPTVDVFVNPPNRLFSQRWRPYSKAPVHVIEVVEPEIGSDSDDVVRRAVDARRTVLDRVHRP
jgi:Glycosyltransferase family 9 (heptosyltransferase)